MRSRIFKALYDNRGEFVSGEALSTSLNISRAAVSKHITALKNDDAIIESVSHKGHCMTGLPDRMKAQYVLPLLNHADAISDFIWNESDTSTNTTLKKLGEQKKEIAICTCENQTSGIGRRGRLWASSIYDGIYISFLLKPDISPSDAFQITCLAAAAQVKSIADITGLDPKIKWPNDIIVNNKKISGTLTEMSSDFDGVRFMVCGIGINVNHDLSFLKDELSEKATSLRIETEASVERLTLFNSLVDTFIAYYQAFLQQGAGAYMDVYRENSAVIGRDVKITSGNQTIEGVVSDIDKSGALLLKTDGQIQRIVAGEVSLRGKNGYV